MKSKFKNLEEMEQRRAFIRGADQGVQINAPVFGDLKQLSNAELVEGIAQVDAQADMWKWALYYELRLRFKSDKLLGQYLAEQRSDPTSAFCASRKDDISRMANAGRLCATYKITDYDRLFLSKTGVYELSKPCYEEVAGKVLSDIKQGIARKTITKTLSLAEVMAYINKATPVATVEHLEPLQAIEQVTETEFVQVIEQVAEISVAPTQVVEQVIELEVKPSQAVALVSEEAVTYIVAQNNDIQVTPDEVIAQEVIQLLIQQGIALRQRIPIFKLCIEITQNEMYPRR